MCLLGIYFSPQLMPREFVFLHYMVTNQNLSDPLNHNFVFLMVAWNFLCFKKIIWYQHVTFLIISLGKIMITNMRIIIKTQIINIKLSVHDSYFGNTLIKHDLLLVYIKSNVNNTTISKLHLIIHII